MTFNCNTTLRGKMQQAAKFAQEANADIFTIQEPFAQNANINDKEKSRHCKQASDERYVLDTSKYQAVLIRDRLAARQINRTTIKNDGRIMVYEFNINKTTNLLLISTYVVVDDGSRDISKNIKENNTRKDIQNNMQSIKNKFIRRTKHNDLTPLILIQGDLQDTVSRTTKDNINTSGSKNTTPIRNIGLVQQEREQEPRLQVGCL